MANVKKVVAIKEQEQDTVRQVLLDAVKQQRQIDKAEGSTSNRLLIVARQYQRKDEVGKEEEANAERFLKVVTDHEKWLKSEEAGRQKCKTIPRAFSQAKSNIKAALCFGLDLNKYETESALRKDVNKIRKGKSANPIDSGFAALKKAVAVMPESEALELLKQFEGLANEVLHRLVPVEPQAPEAEEKKEA